MPVVSVIVAVYNSEEYLDKCIKSICEQTYYDLQIILVDDGSTDSSGKICDEWKMRDNRIEVIHQANKGLVGGRKAGLDKAKGEFVVFVDGDDYIESNMYELMVDKQKKTGADIVNVGFFKGNIKVNICSGIYEINKNEALDNTIQFVFDVNSHTRIYSSIWSKLFRKEYIKTLYSQIPNDCYYCEDLITLLYVMGTNVKMCCVNEALYYYVQREGSIINKTDSLYYLRKIPAICEIKRIIDNYRNSKEMPSIIDIFIKNEIMQGLRKSFDDSFVISQYRIGNIEKYKDARIVVYGTGDVGKDFYSQITREGLCKEIKWVDREKKTITKSIVVEAIDDIDNESFDVLIIAVYDEEVAEIIKSNLLDKGIPERKIIWNKPMIVR